MAGQHARRTPGDSTGDVTGETERDERLMRPDGQRYQAPESDATRSSKNVAYAALGLLVIVLLVLIATGTVRIFPT